MLDVAWYLHQKNQEAITKSNVLSNAATVAKEDDKLKRIICVSQNMLEIMESIKIVSQSNTSVLIVGESGTGKELVAQAIHSVSLRKNKPLVVVNCATLPANLVESELFGHEKGAFTGAINKKTGKFELADGGTIFLDEIGELPLELQVKFLRVLQEQEMEPIGGRLRKIDVRVIAATNRNLEEEIAIGHFRIDLYYRLNVFPIALPPLRERKADVLSLANHFLKLYATREGKNIKGFSENVINLLLTYNWPGNIRELEHLIQRSVLLATEDTIKEMRLPSGAKNSDIKSDTEELAIKTIDENERDYILKILKHVKGRISGEGGAAELLGVPPSTLNSRIKRLGIRREHFG
jgi:two-component system response regulator HydG